MKVYINASRYTIQDNAGVSEVYYNAEMVLSVDNNDTNQPMILVKPIQDVKSKTNETLFKLVLDTEVYADVRTLNDGNVYVQ